MANIEPLLLLVLEVLLALSVAAVFEAIAFCPSFWPSEVLDSPPQFKDNPVYATPPETQRSKDALQPEKPDSPNKDKAPKKKKKVSKAKQLAKQVETVKKERPRKKSKSSKKSQLSTPPQPETSSDLALDGPISPTQVFGPILPPVASRGREPFRGSIVIESHYSAQKFAFAPPYRDDCMIFYTDGSFIAGGNAQKRRAGAAVVFKSAPKDPVWTVRAFQMRFDHCFWTIDDIETWAMATALETAQNLSRAATAAAGCPDTISATDTHTAGSIIDSAHTSIRRVKEVKIFSDSQAAMYRINDTQDPETVFLSSRPGLEKFLHYASQLADAGVKVTLHWCPGHNGVPGNVIADRFSGMGRTYDAVRSRQPSMPKPLEFVSTETHPHVQELVISHPVLDFSLAKLETSATTIPGHIVSARPRPRRVRRAPLSITSTITSINPDNKPQELVTIAAAIEKLTQNQTMLVQMLGSKVQYDAPVIATVSSPLIPTASLETVKPIGLIEAPPEPCENLSPTIHNIKQSRPAMPSYMSGSRVHILGLKGFMPIVGAELEQTSFSSSEEESLYRRGSPRLHGYDSEPDSVVSLGTVATSVGEYGVGEVDGEMQKDNLLEHPDLGPDIPIDQWVDVAGKSNYLREHFPWINWCGHRMRTIRVPTR